MTNQIEYNIAYYRSGYKKNFFGVYRYENTASHFRRRCGRREDACAVAAGRPGQDADGAAGLLTSEKGRKGVGFLLVAIFAPVICLVGYTNAGKSTLLNALTGAGIPANDRLFDTLDTTSRQLTVSDTCQAILSDTVGFIAKLPHHLIEAFQATLEELQYADLILHVIDAAVSILLPLSAPGKEQLSLHSPVLVPEDGAPNAALIALADVLPPEVYDTRNL